MLHVDAQDGAAHDRRLGVVGPVAAAAELGVQAVPGGDLDGAVAVVAAGQNEKVTLLPAESVESTRRLVADGGADRVSGFIRYVVQVALDDATGWAALPGQALIDAGER